MAPSKKSLDLLAERMQKLKIYEEDLVEKFILGSGKGGQKINKTSSCVYLKHTPSQLEVKCQQDRSREMNRFLARKMLCEKIEETQNLEQKTAKQKIFEKVRKQKERRARRAKKLQALAKQKSSYKKAHASSMEQMKNFNKNH